LASKPEQKLVYRKHVVFGHSVFVAAAWHAVHITAEFKDALEAARLTGYRTLGPCAPPD
jgi:hypothetical protein